MDNREKEIKDLLVDNNNKLVADKIIQTLLNIRNVPGISKKRWIWELIQNAKDAYNPKFGNVGIRIELKKNSLLFSHNGTFFSVKNVLGILQQISSKNSQNNDGQTGKFGTGFIGTHLLSSKVKIQGIIYYLGKYKKFKINLDRSSNSSEELAKGVKKSIDDFIKNMDINKENESEYETIGEVYNQRSTNFHTSFEYIIETDDQLNTAEDGLKDLSNTAPVTLSNLSDKISQITIKDERNNKETEYSVESKNIYSQKDNIIKFHKVTIKTNKNEEDKYFYSCENRECRLFFQAKKNQCGYEVVERDPHQPILLRDFPLIGSENFYFPFFLNGFKFNTLETRSGLYLNGNYDEAKQNKEIIESAINLSVEFIQYLISGNYNRKYLFAYSNIPEPPQKYDRETFKWFIERQKLWRQKLLAFELCVDEDNIPFQLRELRLPKFEKEFRNNKYEYNRKFFNLFKDMNITGGKLPKEEDAQKWYEIMEKDPIKELYDDLYNIKENTWGEFRCIFTEEDCFKYISEKGNILNFYPETSKKREKAIEWLNKFYKFLLSNNCIDCFNQYNIIPNKNDNFKRISEIYINDKKDSVPEIIEPIYQKIFKKEIKDIYLNEDIDDSIFKDKIKKKNFEDILTEFSNFLKEDNNDKLKIELCNELISYSLKNVRINSMYDFNIETDRTYKIKYGNKKKLKEYHKNHNIWRDIEDFWFEYHSKKIEDFQNVDNLKEILTDDKYKNDPYVWLDKYIKFLKDNSTNVEDRKIFPNQKGEFKQIKNLKIDDNLPELLKEIYNKLKSDKDHQYEIKKCLLDPRIKSCSEYNKFTQKELIGHIENLFIECRESVLKTSIAEKLVLSLIPKNDTKKLKIVNKALNEFIEYYNKFKEKNLKPDKEIMITTEINYGIFVKFLLQQLFDDIQKWKGLNDIIQIIEKIKIIDEQLKDLRIYKIDMIKLSNELETLRSENANRKAINNKEKEIEAASIIQTNINGKENELRKLNEDFEKKQKEIDEKTKIIAKLIKFAWDNQVNDCLYLAIEPKDYKIFLNQKYEFKKISEIYIKEDFEDLKYSELEKKLFNLSTKNPINIDYESWFLSKNYDIILKKYKNNFRTLKLSDICQKIDYNLTSFFYDHRGYNFQDKKFKDFIISFKTLHEIIQQNKELKKKFPRFIRERGAIALKFLEKDEDDLDDLMNELIGSLYYKTIGEEN